MFRWRYDRQRQQTRCGFHYRHWRPGLIPIRFVFIPGKMMQLIPTEPTDKTDISKTSAVGCFPTGASPYGVEELSGNVWEWTRSLRDFRYPYDPGDGREKLNAYANTSRVIRGGAYWNEVDAVGCGLRYWDFPNFRYDRYGFRIVASPSTSVF
ncbi:SUMF1/EgtB/PvdO family nonheme iron enzyme [Chloroflexi bacterium TSY]|nr:SUMF1/EgtB/PvdO family nonheme iron enzyme [Chloroflexi bacterium TSY]